MLPTPNRICQPHTLTPSTSAHPELGCQDTEVESHRGCVGARDGRGWGKLPWGWERRNNILPSPGNTPNYSPHGCGEDMVHRTRGWAARLCTGSQPLTGGWPSKPMDSSSPSPFLIRQFPLSSLRSRGPNFSPRFTLFFNQDWNISAFYRGP